MSLEFLSTALPIIVTLGVLIWGLRQVGAALNDDKQTKANRFLLEKSPESKADKLAMLKATLAANENLVELTDAQLEKLTETVTQDVSFSRVAGSIGAVALAAFFAGLSVWIFFALNDHQLYPESGAEDAERKPLIDRVSDLGTFILAGSALFIPYAFNRLSGIFRP